MQNKVEPILSKNFIIHKEQYANYECIVCLQLSDDLLRCKGSCKKPLCSICFSKILITTNQCPNKCTQNVQVQIVQNVQLQYKCPYSKQCPDQIIGLTSFKKHVENCCYMSPIHRQQLQYIRQYKCWKGHQLTFLSHQVFMRIYGEKDIYKFAISQNCRFCRQKNMCRSICLECGKPWDYIIFCCSCRPPPCSKKTCPIGHQFVRSDTSLVELCDICGKSMILFGLQSLDDSQCNFNICLHCQKSLPQQQALIPLANLVPAECSVSQHCLNQLLNNEQQQQNNWQQQIEQEQEQEGDADQQQDIQDDVDNQQH